jgi:hypothetical protein
VGTGGSETTDGLKLGDGLGANVLVGLAVSPGGVALGSATTVGSATA